LNYKNQIQDLHSHKSKGTVNEIKEEAMLLLQNCFDYNFAGREKTKSVYFS